MFRACEAVFDLFDKDGTGEITAEGLGINHLCSISIATRNSRRSFSSRARSPDMLMASDGLRQTAAGGRPVAC